MIFVLFWKSRGKFENWYWKIRFFIPEPFTQVNLVLFLYFCSGNWIYGLIRLSSYCSKRLCGTIVRAFLFVAFNLTKGALPALWAWYQRTAHKAQRSPAKKNYTSSENYSRSFLMKLTRSESRKPGSRCGQIVTHTFSIIQKLGKFVL